MKNLNQSGKVMALVAPYDRTSGQGALVGSQFGVAVSDVLSGASGEFLTRGIVTLAKTDSQAWVLGDKIYWDDTNKRCDNTPVGPCVGTAAAAVASTTGLVTGSVKLSEAPAGVPGATVADTVAAAAATAGGSSPTAAQVDTGIATAVAPLVVSINTILDRLQAAGIILTEAVGFLDALAAADQAVGERLGEAIIYTPGTGAPVTPQGLFDEAYQLVDAGGQSGVSSTRPAVSLLLSDLPSDPKTDLAARVTIHGTIYKAWKVEPDGKGRTLMILQKA